MFALRLLHRKSSIAPNTLATFNPVTGLSREKAVISNGVVLVYQNFSKTNQFKSSTRTNPLVPGSVAALDPVFHYSKLISENIVCGNFSAFSFIANNGIKFVTYKSFMAFLKQLLINIGLDSSLWSGHSFRRSGATLLYRLGIDPLTIQACGDYWSSDTCLDYLTT